MSDITISRGVRSNLLALQNIASNREVIQGRLASGKKVNSALDNPTNFFTAAALNSRGNDLGALLDGMSNGIKTLEAADNGLKSITKTVESLQSTIRQARQDKSWKGDSYSFTAGAAGTVSISNGAVGSTAVNISVTSTDTIDDVVKNINNNSSLTGKVRASNDNGKLRIENLSTADLTVTNSGSVGTGSTVGGNTVRADLITQFNDLRQQLDRTAEDASFNGINLLRGDSLAITFNETGSSSVTIQSKGGKAINSSNLGIDAQVTSVADSDSSLDSILGKLTTAMNSLRSQSSAFGSNLSVVQNRQDFTKSMINTLKGGADNLTLADQNEEGANLLALNTRAQLATSALSFASQGDQQVLQFLR
ncbi:flagellin [Phreatobacter oligotrophus]|uniref:Flagellin n=1 Tax=Phreatobacter oligotrophus TaxID=1122261 RepID=A0A2T4Z325_9HYPH|nr:flagellin [Phreatobacter oligotrophus]PTM55138.1 flagellin-like hook-associated protein FlgL [Phreatobacter oligotrophus]